MSLLSLTINKNTKIRKREEKEGGVKETEVGTDGDLGGECAVGDQERRKRALLLRQRWNQEIRKVADQLFVEILKIT